MSGICLKCCLVRRFSVRQVNRFHWDESLTVPSRQPHLGALWAPAKLLWCNPGGTRLSIVLGTVCSFPGQLHSVCKLYSGSCLKVLNRGLTYCLHDHTDKF